MGYVFSVINVVLFIIILWAVLKKPVQIFFSTRKEQFKAQIALAEKRRLAAEAKLQESEAHFPYFKEDVEKLASSTLRHGEQESHAIVSTAQERAERMILDARRHVSQEIARMQQDLYTSAMDRAFDRATEEIKESIDAAQARKLVKRSITMIGSFFRGPRTEDQGPGF
jgi:F0F1-type ATP synthase membrane subunit b/b'